MCLLEGQCISLIREQAQWIQQAYLKVSSETVIQGNGLDQFFGYSVSISEDTLVVGSPFAGATLTPDVSLIPGPGRIFVFTRNGGIWSEQEMIEAPNSDEVRAQMSMPDQFGESVAISGDTLVVGAPGEDSAVVGVNGDELDNSARASGAAYVYVRSGGRWTKEAFLKASNTDIGDSFGADVDISGDTIVVGASKESSSTMGVGGNELDNSENDSGAVYVYSRSSGIWRQQEYLKPLDTQVGNGFGFSVAISDNSIAVGAIGENSAATGINGDEFDNSAGLSGAAYVFNRSEGTWRQDAFIKASNTDAGDFFGASVDISGDALVVGSWWEASDSTGVNGDESDNSKPFAGAVYLYSRSSGNWTQQAYLKPSNSAGEFGGAVSISGDTVAVGAIREGLFNYTNGSGAVYVFAPEFTEEDTISIEAFHSALWYDPSENGHGIAVYLLDDQGIIVIWYVYDDSGNPFWLLGVGTHDGNIASLDVSITDGPMFPPNFDTNDLNITNWGQFELSFSSCDQALFKWMPNASSSFSSGSRTMVRLSTTFGLTCDEVRYSKESPLNAETSKASHQSLIDPAHSALWYNPNESGHGINVYLLQDQGIIVIWYVYDDNGNSLWLLGVGTHDGSKARLAVSITSGPKFPPNFDTTDLEIMDWGEFELSFTDCNDGVFRWLPIPGNGFTSGELAIVRLNQTLGLDCPE